MNSSLAPSYRQALMQRNSSQSLSSEPARGHFLAASPHPRWEKALHRQCHLRDLLEWLGDGRGDPCCDESDVPPLLGLTLLSLFVSSAGRDA